MHKLSHQLFTS